MSIYVRWQVWMLASCPNKLRSDLAMEVRSSPLLVGPSSRPYSFGSTDQSLFAVTYHVYRSQHLPSQSEMTSSRSLALICIFLILSTSQLAFFNPGLVGAMCPMMMMRAQSAARQFNRFRNPELDFPSPGTAPNDPAPTNETVS